ncbi:unnamed protein product [Rhizoctonia solani]|uniref:Hydrolase Mb2248c n=1 Tax=Rhizoctonia solani TaxID=456999 RepID=A0A8H2WFB9_9AGAM|nr:unnamed protein product [Rhizoctonia solani]
MAPPLQSIILGAILLARSINAQHWLSAEGYDRFAPRVEDFQWGKCDPDTASRECSRFEVPLDWANHAAGKASLYVARYNATKEPKLGTIFVNPGGPGSSGVKAILGNLVLNISEASGGEYDIVGWDPRGIGKSVPRAECFKNGAEENAFWEGTVPRAGLEARGNFTDQADIDAFKKQVDQVDRLLKELGERCVAYSPDTFQYIGSAAAVRDMIAMHDVLEKRKKPVNFWGLSYGTIIGIYFVNMFPDRVGHVVLDGVVDPELWANKPSYQKWAIKPKSTEQTFAGFLKECTSAGPSRCSIASKGSTPEALRQYISDLIDRAYDYKHKYRERAKFGSFGVRSAISHGMYKPSSWPGFVDRLERFGEDIDANATLGPQAEQLLPAPLIDMPIIQSTTENSMTDDDPAPDYSFQGVTCADGIDSGNTTTKDVFDFLVNVTRTVSSMFGPQWGDGGLYCHRWPVRAVERYTGPWNKKLANTILVIGNTGDPVTPYESAKKVADALGDSAALIKQEEYGHTSLAMHSNCTIASVQNYFVNNKLPAHEWHCGTDQRLFPEPTFMTNMDDAVSASIPEASSLQKVLHRGRQGTHDLFIFLAALAASTGLILLFWYIVGRQRSKNVRETSRTAYEKSIEEHEHDNPYAPKLNGNPRVKA